MKYILLCLLTSNLHGLALTGGELGVTFEPKLNRTFYTGVDFTIFGSVIVDSCFTARGGAELGTAGGVLNMDAFAKAEYTFPLKIPLSISFRYVYNALPEYKTYMQALSPMFALKGRWIGTAIGPVWRFSTFKKETIIRESIFAFSLYLNVYDTAKGRIGFECANYTDFSSGNMGAYSLKIYSLLRITEGCSFINDVTFYQTGSVGFSAQLYGITYRGGILLTW
ncbi:MAG: hypothetical protein LBG90_03655 [Spirochaetaceae bacterium]|nr:hypothetical protein [Spirochaetaceae bacterium]